MILRRGTPRTAFVLSGGGNLGALQVGMLAALAERGVEADVVLGCSVGALNGAAYSLEPTTGGVDNLATRWAEIDSPTLMPSSLVPNALQLLRKGESLHDNEGLRRTLVAMLGATSSFEDLQVEFQCVAADVDTAMEHWFSEGEIVPAVMASAALPAVYPPVEVDGARYLDGGVIDNVPIARAVELGCSRIFVLGVGPHGRPEVDIRRPLDGALLAYWVARNSRFARDLAALPPGVEAIVLPPGERPDLRYDDFTQSSSLIERGYRQSAAFLERRAVELAAVEARGTLRSRLGRLRLPAGLRRTRAAEEAVSDPQGAIVLGDDEPDVPTPGHGEDPSGDPSGPPRR